MLVQFARRVVGPFLVHTIGRRSTVRLGHYLLDFARRDVRNDPSNNGEYLVQDAIVQMCADRKEPVVFDIGANVGDWTASFVDRLPQSSSVRVFAAEPATSTFDQLAKRCASLPDGKALVTPIKVAFSASPGSGKLHIFADLAGINSLHPTWDEDLRTEAVVMESVDSFGAKHSLASICFMKIDTEGHDFEVIRGASAMLSSHSIWGIQFEYNHRWIHSKHFLKDVFDFLLPLGYEIGKVTPDGIEFYSAWTAELESFREGNYVACLSEVRKYFPIIRWWRE